MRAVREFKPRGNCADGLVCFSQALCSLFQAEGHAIVKKAQTGVFIYNAVEIIAAVIKKLFHLRTRHATVAFLKEPCNT